MRNQKERAGQGGGALPPGVASAYSKRIAAISLILIAYFTLFPFDFFFDNAPSLIEVLQNFDLNLTRTYAAADFPRNLALFLPLGFGLAGVVFSSAGRKFWAFFLVVFAGVWLSLTAEMLQTYTLQRFPAFGDVLANGVGTAVGGLIFLLFGGRLLNAMRRLAGWLKSVLTIRRAAVACLLYAAGWLALSLLIQQETRLSNWETGYHLMIGNEATGDRPWQGVIQQLFILDEALPEAEIGELFGESFPAVSEREVTVAHYNFAGNGQENFPALGWQGDGAGQITAEGAVLSETQWLQTQSPVGEISRRLASSSEFTVGISAASADLSQEGPARLVSISEDAFLRNLTVAQEGMDLALRIRTPLTGLNGRLPEFVFPGVFDDQRLHQIVIRYDGAAVHLYTDNLANHSAVELLPAIAIFTNFFPDDVERLRINDGNRLIFSLLYRAAVFLPLALLAAAWGKSQAGIDERWLFWLAAAAGICLLWELLLGAGLPGYGARAGSMALNLVVTAVGFVIAYRQL